jgi:hypothetical protein
MPQLLYHGVPPSVVFTRNHCTPRCNSKTARGRRIPDQLQVAYLEDFFSSLKTEWFPSPVTDNVAGICHLHFHQTGVYYL